jgi:uncharacterized membrane protein
VETVQVLWARLTTGFWLLPGSLVAVFAGAALVLVEFDRGIGYENGLPRTFDGDADAAHSILGAIVAGYITVSGVAFSITLVTLQLVSSQYSPLALGTFLSDRANQVVVGVFVGIVVYALLVLRVVRSGGEDALASEFVPRLGVSVGIALALVGLVLLVYFIHHLATSIQVTSITERVGTSTLQSVETLYPERFAAPEPEDADRLLAEWGHASVPGVVRAGSAGYVGAVAVGSVSKGLPAGARVHVRVRPGDFVTPADVLVSIWPAELADEARAARVRGGVALAAQRTDTQDLRFGLRQLGDVALRALSPSLNDPTTAVTCLGYLRAVLEELAVRSFPARVRRAGEDEPLLVVERASFQEHLQPLVEIGMHATAEPRVLEAVLATLESVESRAREAGALEHAAVAADARAGVVAAGEPASA